MSASDLAGVPQTQATTILAFKYLGGVLVAGDRGHGWKYRRLRSRRQVLEIDRHSIMAIAGVPATAWEMRACSNIPFSISAATQLQE